MDASNYRTLLAGYYATRLGLSGSSMDVTDVMFPAKSGLIVVSLGSLRLPFEEGGFLHFFGSLSSTGASSQRQFIGIYSEGHEAYRDLVAAAWHYNAQVAALKAGDVFPVAPKSRLRVVGYEHALVLDAGLYAFFEEDAHVQLGNVGTHFNAVLPLTRVERDSWARVGYSGFLDKWADEGKDYLNVKAIPEGSPPTP